MSNVDKDEVRGLKTEINPNDYRRDHRSPKQKFSDAMADPNSFAMIMVMYLSVFFVLPAMTELWIPLGFWLINYASKKEFRLPFRIPKSSGLLDPSEPLDFKTKEVVKAEGIHFFGNERGTSKELWFNNSDMRTHILIFGSTGAGKALRYNELVHTPSGWKKNKDLKIGELVSTPNGTSPIVGIYPQGKLKLYRIVFKDRRFIDVSGDHLWEVHNESWYAKLLDLNVKEKAKVLTTIEIKNYLEKNSNEILSIIVPKPVEQKEINLNNLYSIGYNLINENIELIKQIKNGSIRQRLDFIQGVNDKFANVDESIILNLNNDLIKDEISIIINSLGGLVSYENGLFTIYHQNPSILFSDCEKMKKSLKLGIKDLKLEIISITETNVIEECQCIKIADARGLFITKDYLVTHNTETLLSLAYNALVQGSGLIYVDGKGENVLYTKIFAMARTMGREDDVLVINYMTGSRDVFGPQEKKLSNTLNPFSSGGTGGLTELLVSLMDDGGGGGDMWKGRAISLISAIMMALVYLRDQKELLLDVDAIREHLILDSIIKIYKTRKDFPIHIRNALRAYLVSLPGFQESAPKQNDTVMEQHGYLQMQFTKLLGSLSDTYGFIFRTNLGEVDFKDVVLNRRILVVLLPALEKSTDELANLGKIIVACLKQMMASALGATIEGSYAEVVDTKPTNADMPFMTVLDEYGYYAVKGSAVMPAQARSIGFSMIFAGQDLPAFEKASKEEAASIVANCNVKIFMKLEDPDSTYQLFEKSVGEALSASVGSLEFKSGLFGSSYVAGQTPNVQMLKRGNLLDLKDQNSGQAHIIFKSAVIRANMFYASPPKPPHIRMNYFVRVEPPDISVINQMDNRLKQLIKNLTNLNKIREMEENLELDNPHIDKLKSLLENHSSLSNNESSFATIAALGSEVFNAYDERLGEFKRQIEEDSEEEIEEDSMDIFKESVKEDSFFTARKTQEAKFKSRDEDLDDNDFDDDDEDDVDVFLEETETKNSIENFAKLMGESSSSAKETAETSAQEMRTLTKYPGDSKPSTKDPEEIMDVLKELDDMFDSDD
jgi:intracellular multiplication protein IcmO